MQIDPPFLADNVPERPDSPCRANADSLGSGSFAQYSVDTSVASDRQSPPPSYESLFPECVDPIDSRSTSASMSRSSSIELPPNPTPNSSSSDLEQEDHLPSPRTLRERLSSLDVQDQPPSPGRVFRAGPSNRSQDNLSLSSTDGSRSPSPCDDSPLSSTEFDRKMPSACLADNVQAIQKLLHLRPGGIHRFQENSATSAFLHPLHLAAMHNRTDTLDYLCKQPGIDVNIRDDAGQTPLILAVKHNQVAAIKLLCQQPGIDVNAKNNLGQQPLQLAVKLNHKESVQHLSQQPGIALNARDETGQTLLMLAVRNSYTSAMRSLCAQKKIDINATDKSGNTAILLSIQRNNTAITRLLLEKGARVSGAGKNLYNSPLYAAIAGDGVIQGRPSPYCRETLELLLCNGADPNQIIDHQHSLRPLHIAAHFGRSSAIDVLVAHGANPRCRNDCRATPMHFAALAQNEDVMKQLLAHGATLSEGRGVIDRRFWYYTTDSSAPDPGAWWASPSVIRLCGRFHNKGMEPFYCYGGQPLDLYLGSPVAMIAAERESLALRGGVVAPPFPRWSCQLM